MLGIRIGFNPDGSFYVENVDGKGILRPKKGKSLLKKTRDFTAVDIETTGLSSYFDSIIELAAVKYRDGIPISSYEQLVYPGMEIDEFITDLTGITNSMLAGMPEIKDVLQDFLTFIGDDTIVGHNVNFDINFIYDNCEESGIDPVSNDFIDTMRIAKRLYKDWPNHKLDTLAANLNVGGRGFHRALSDAQLTADCYLQMIADQDYDFAMKPAGEVRAKDIVAQDGFLNEDSPIFGKVCVFTGALESFTRKEAMQIVTNIGGICGDGVTKKTNFLVLGNNDYCKTIKDGKSSKQKKAEKLILEGADLQIINETAFLEMISNN